jgi:hypothetical protein
MSGLDGAGLGGARWGLNSLQKEEEHQSRS